MAKAKGKKKSGKKSGALATRPGGSGGGLMLMPVGKQLPAFPEYTAVELGKMLDATADLANALHAEAGLKFDALADHLFRVWFLGSVRLALDPQAPVPPGLPELLARGGKSIPLEAATIRRYAKVGALNQHVREGSWRHLPFHLKFELVRLVRSADDFGKLGEGIAFANRANVGRDAVREWVNGHSPPSEVGGRPRGITVRGVASAATPVLRLSDAEALERVAENASKLPEREREAFLGELEEAAKNLQRLVRETRARADR